LAVKKEGSASNTFLKDQEHAPRTQFSSPQLSYERFGAIHSFHERSSFTFILSMHFASAQNPTYVLILLPLKFMCFSPLQYFKETTFRRSLTKDQCQPANLPDGTISYRTSCTVYCRESRQVALECYRLAFSGHNTWICHTLKDEDWERSGHGQKKIWFDFEHDTMLLSCHTRRSMLLQPLEFLSLYVPNEASDIQHVVLCGNWNTFQRPGVLIRKCLTVHAHHIKRTT